MDCYIYYRMWLVNWFKSTLEGLGLMKQAGQERAKEKRSSKSSSGSKSQESETPAAEVNKMLKGLFGR